MSQALEHEAALFAANIDEWRRTQPGKFVLIKEQSVVGFFLSLDQAFAEGTARFGLEPFLVRQIVPQDIVNVSFFGQRIHVA